MKNLLVIYKSGTLAINNLLPKVLILEKIQEVETHRIPESNREIKSFSSKILSISQS